MDVMVAYRDAKAGWLFCDKECGEQQLRDIVAIFNRYGYEIDAEQEVGIIVTIEVYHSFAHFRKVRNLLELIIRLMNSDNKIEVGGDLIGEFEDEVRGYIIDGLIETHIITSFPEIRTDDCSKEFILDLYDKHLRMENGLDEKSRIKFKCINGLMGIIPNPPIQKVYYECLYDIVEYLQPCIWGDDIKVKRRYTDKSKVISGVVRRVKKYYDDIEKRMATPESQKELDQLNEMMEDEGYKEMTEQQALRWVIERGE